MSVLQSVGYRHSPSSINGFVDAPQKELAYRLFGIKSPKNDNMVRGNCVEAAVRYILHRSPTESNLRRYVDSKWDKLKGVDPKYYQWCADAASLMSQELEQRQLRRIKKFQEPFHGTHGSFNCYGLADFTFNDVTVDIKAPSRMPNYNIPNTNWIRQQSFYWGLSGKKRRFALLYGTNKKCEYYEISQKELAEGWEIMKSNMSWIERIDNICQTKQNWIDMFPFPDTNSFYYSDENFKQKIITLLKGEQNAND